MLSSPKVKVKVKVKVLGLNVLFSLIYMKTRPLGDCISTTGPDSGKMSYLVKSKLNKV